MGYANLPGTMSWKTVDDGIMSFSKRFIRPKVSKYKMLMLLPPSMRTLERVYPPTWGATTKAKSPGLSTLGGWSSLLQVMGCSDQ